MIRKKALLIVFFLFLFVFQQAQASANFLPNKEEVSQTNLIQTNDLPAQLSITVFELNTDTNYPAVDINGQTIKCFYNDPAYGCGEGGSGYPDTQNPITIDLEEYILDVIPREMNVAVDDPTLEALKAQALAVRSYAAFRNPTNNSVQFQIFIPNAYELYNPSYTNLIGQAVTSTQGYYLSQGGSVIDAQFASDSINRTATCLNEDGTQCHPYLIKVEDPISAWQLSNPACDAINNGNSTVDDPATTDVDERGKVWGMSQKGATRWSLSNHCTTIGGNQPWPVKWSDYRQILVHYYTGIDILDAGGNKKAPDDRWNLLNYADLPENVAPGQPFSLTLTVQNTSTTAWDRAIVGWKWVSTSECDSAWSWDATQPLLNVAPGATADPNPMITITAPPNAGTYILHVDVKRENGDWFQYQSPKWPDAQIQVQVGSDAPIDPNAGPGYYPQGITGCYYNDTQPATIPPAPPDPPINWDTFTNFATTIPNLTPGFERYYPLTSPAKGVVHDTFWSARWVGKLNVLYAGEYTFHLGFLDDGGRIFIDKITDNDTPIIESWKVQGPHNYDGDSPVYLTSGLHDIRIDYAQGPLFNSTMYVLWSCLNCSHPLSREIIQPALPLPLQVTISGSAGEQASGATLYYIDGIAKSVMADASGNYSLIVPYGWSGTVTPSLAGYIFNPSSISYPGVYADQTSTTQDYAPTFVSIVTVINTDNSGPGSLRDAIASASTTPGATIIFAPELSGATISLSSPLSLTKNVTIDGSMLTTPISINGAGATPHVTAFSISYGVTVALNHLTITEGNPGINNSGMLTIRNSNIVGNNSRGVVNNGGGSLTVTDSTFSDNIASAHLSGGGIYNYGKLTVISSTFSDNTATTADYASGGGILNLGELTVMSSTFSDNIATSSGGGIDNRSGELTVMNSTFSGNAASSGGGIYNAISYPEYITVTNSTFIGNTATYGGGIYNNESYNSKGYLVVTNSTFSGNTATSEGGGVYNNSLLYYANSILANSTGGDCFNSYNGTITLNINNLVEDGSCPTDGINFKTGDPNLGVLSSNGGPTQTLALLPGSPALNAGDSTFCEQAPVNNRDQRDVIRTQDTQCDIGAYEIDPTVPTVDNFTVPSSSSSLNIPILTFTTSDDVGVTGYMITESAVPPLAGDTGWTNTVPTTYTVGTSGTHTLYPWVKDADENVSSAFSSPATVIVDTTAPTVVSITRASPNPTNAASVNFTVRFSEPVTGVDVSDFTLRISGVTGATVRSVSGSGQIYTVTVNTGCRDGTIRLDIMNTATIMDLVSNPLITSFTRGEVYTAVTIGSVCR